MRGEQYLLLQLKMQKKIRGEKSIGRRKQSWLRNLLDWFGMTNNHLFKSAVSKIGMVLMIALLRNQDGA